MFDWQQFLDDVAEVSRGDYVSAFKMLGAVLYISEQGVEPLLAGRMVSPRTVYRWLETIRAAGWGSLVSEARVMQAIREHLTSLQSTDTKAARASIVRLLDAALAESASAQV